MFVGEPMRDIDANSYTGRRRLLVINRTVVEVNGRHIYTALRRVVYKVYVTFAFKCPVATSKIRNLSDYLEITNFVARTRETVTPILHTILLDSNKTYFVPSDGLQCSYRCYSPAWFVRDPPSQGHRFPSSPVSLALHFLI